MSIFPSFKQFLARSADNANYRLIARQTAPVTPPIPDTILVRHNGMKAIVDLGSAAITVTATGYSAGNVVGGKLTIPNVVRGGDCAGARVNRIVLTDKSGNATNYDVFLFDTNPTNSTFTDKSALSLNVADLPFCCGVVQLTVQSAGGAGIVESAPGLDFDIMLTTTTLYAVIVARGTPTYASTHDVGIRFELVQD